MCGLRSRGGAGGRGSSWLVAALDGSDVCEGAARGLKAVYCARPRLRFYLGAAAPGPAAAACAWRWLRQLGGRARVGAALGRASRVRFAL